MDGIKKFVLKNYTYPPAVKRGKHQNTEPIFFCFVCLFSITEDTSFLLENLNCKKSCKSE